MTIPRILHQIWMQGKDRVPPHLLKIQESWKQTHPHLEIRVWDESLLRRLEPSRWSKLIEYHDLRLIQRADIWRCAVLELFGGIYSDFDMFALKDIWPILDQDKMNIGQSHSSITRVQNSILASAPAHPGWDAVYDAIRLSLHTRTLIDDVSPSYNVINTTGPVAWSRAVAKATPLFHQWPAEFFFSKHVHKGKLRLDAETDMRHLQHSYGYHVQEVSWMRGHEALIINCITAWFNTRPELKALLLTSALCFIWGICGLGEK